MKNTLILVFSILLLFGNAQELKLASDIWPPFTNTAKEKICSHRPC